MRLRLKAICLFFLLMSGQLIAAEPEWGKQPFGYYGEGASLAELLENFGANYRIPVTVSSKIIEPVNGQLDDMPPKELLDRLATLYNLVWYYDGSMLYVYKANESTTVLVQLKLLTLKRLKKALIESDVWDERFSWRPVPDKKLIYVSGPPRYVELVEQMSNVLEQQLADQQYEELFIDIIPLKYASAADRTLSYRDETVVIPGVATVLQDILNEYQENNLKKKDKLGVEGEESKISATSVAMSGAARVEADPRLNAVIVRDRIDRLPLYRRLIKTLDIPQRRIELALYIVDINAENLDELGVEWRAGLKVGDKGYLDIISTGSRSGDDGLQLGSGEELSTILDTAASSFFLARLRLLAKEGQAQVVSRPTLLTRENIEAVLDNNTTFFVSLTGERAVELREITYGTLLRIIPRVIEESNKDPLISLGLRIEDGNRLGAAKDVGDLPSVRNTVIDTEASVRLGQSLLIGGIYVDRLEYEMLKVPFLGDIPGLGELFKTRTNSLTKSVRLFLIEPRIIGDINIARGGDDTTLRQAPEINQRLDAMADFSNRNPAIHAWSSIARCTDRLVAEKLIERLRASGQKALLRHCKRLDGSNGWKVSNCSEHSSCVAVQGTRS